MKRKYYYPVSVGIIFMAICTALFWVRYAPQNVDLRIKRVQLPPMPPINMPSPQVLSEIERHQNRLQRLQVSAGGNGAAVDLRLFGYRIPQNFTPATAATSTLQPEFPAYSLTFAFSSKKKQYCIVNDKLYTLGELLPDGGRILKIESDRVMIEKESARNWVYMDTQRMSAPENKPNKNEEQPS